MLGLLSLLVNRHHLLHMAQVHTAVGEEPTDKQGQIRRLVNSRAGHQEKPDPWCSPWSVREEVHVFQGARYSAKSRKEKVHNYPRAVTHR